MPKREKVPEAVKPSAGQLGNVIARMVARIPSNYSGAECERIANDKRIGAQFDHEIETVFAKFRLNGASKVASTAELARWQRNYEKLFGKKLDFSGITIPAKPEDLGPMRLIMIVQEITEWTNSRPLQGTVGALKKHFPCWQYTKDLDEALVNDRDPRNGSYAIWIKNVREADEENASQSANDLAQRGHKGMTILERMLVEADYFFEHGEHMDWKNITLCAGSRGRGGRVPGASWRGAEFGMHGDDPSRRYSNLRSRSVWV